VFGTTFFAVAVKRSEKSCQTSRLAARTILFTAYGMGTANVGRPRYAYYAVWFAIAVPKHVHIPFHFASTASVLEKNICNCMFDLNQIILNLTKLQKKKSTNIYVALNTIKNMFYDRFIYVYLVYKY